MKRFLFISTAENLSWGGSEALWAAVAERLLAAGQHVAYSYQYFPEEPKPLAALRAKGAVGYYRDDPAERGFGKRVRRTVARNRLKKQFPAFTESHWLLSLVMTERPDLVVLNACDAYHIWPLAGAFRQIKQQGIPYIILCHLEDESQILFPDKRQALVELYSGASEVGFGAKFGAELVMRQLATPIPTIEIFDNPPNCSGNIQPWPAAGGPARFACVGRLDVTAKAQDVLLAAFARDVWRSRDWQLTFYGKGWEDAYLQKLITLYKLEKQVRFAGFKENIDHVWADEEICLQPSPKEGTPMTVVEAMSAGRPCLVTDIGRMPDLITDGERGWVCSRGVASVAQALERAWTERERWPEMGQRAHDFIRRTWTWDYPAQMAKRLANAPPRN